MSDRGSLSVANVFHELRSRGHYVECGVPMSALSHSQATEHPSTSVSISPLRDRRTQLLISLGYRTRQMLFLRLLHSIAEMSLC